MNDIPGRVETPVLFVVFNRMETVRKTFEAIRRARPVKLFISADGPRENRPGEKETCESVRNYILEHIDWECDVRTRFLEKNLGCCTGVCSAIDWFFSEVEEGIILEDDCVPGEDFFRYAAAALEFYRDNPSVMHINGTAFRTPADRGRFCSVFYRYPHVWGWASWRRAWQFFDVDIRNFSPEKMYEVFPDDRKQAARWNEILKKVSGKVPGFDACWDFQWAYAVMSNKGKCLSPVCNLVSNIGAEGTHIMGDSIIGLQTSALPETLCFPTDKEDHLPRKLEDDVYRMIYRKKSLLRRILNKIMRIFSLA